MAVYLLHFESPIAHAQHYIGWADDRNLARRIQHHRSGTGARLTQVALERGIDFVVVRVWPGEGRSFERRLKNRKNARARLCPLCRDSQSLAVPVASSSMGYDVVRKEELRIMGFQEYRRNPEATIMAKEVTGGPIQCSTKHGPVDAQPGQFIVEQPDGERYPISAEDLERAYILVEGDVLDDDDPGESTGPVGFPAEIGIITQSQSTD